MLKYTFGKLEGNKEFPPRPYVMIEIDPGYISDEINHFSGNDLKDIVDRLERVKQGTKNDCLFGGEISFINCRRKAEDEEYIPGKITCVIDYGFGKDNKRMNINFEDIYNLMKDWKEYVEQWEHETGLVKSGRFD